MWDGLPAHRSRAMRAWLATQQSWLVVEQGRIDEAIELLRSQADTGGRSGLQQLAWLLAEQDRMEEAIELLRSRADAGYWTTAWQLVGLLAKNGSVDELRTEVDAGTPTASERLLALLTERGQTDQAEQLRRWGTTPDGVIAGVEDHYPG